METIKTTAASAANAVTSIVWGTNGNSQEPQSGVQGNPAKGEPFDGGNIGTTSPAYATHLQTNGARQEPTKSAQSGSEPAQPAEPAEPKKTVGGASHNQDSSVEAGDSTKAQNDVRSPSDPQTEPKNAEAAQNVDDTGEGPNTVKLDTPGPKPIEQVAREHGGDAGNLGKDGVEADKGSEKSAKEEKDDDSDGPQTTSHGEGTGELYVKSSGLKADGGDFDASNPGAGREADRKQSPDSSIPERRS